MLVDPGVVEEIDRRPTAALLNAVVFQRIIEVVGTVWMPEVAHVLIIFGGTGETEGVVLAAGVLYHLHQWLHVLVKEFGKKTGPWVTRAHQCSRGGSVQSTFQTAIELFLRKRQKIRTFTTSHINDLKEFAGLYRVSASSAPLNSKIFTRIGQRLGQRGFGPKPFAGAVHPGNKGGGRRLFINRHSRTRG